jgi:hypothetical protein
MATANEGAEIRRFGARKRFFCSKQAQNRLKTEQKSPALFTD